MEHELIKEAASTEGRFSFSTLTAPLNSKIAQYSTAEWGRLWGWIHRHTHAEIVDFWREMGCSEKGFALKYNRLVDGGTSILTNYLVNTALTRPTVIQLGGGHLTAQPFDRTRNNCITAHTGTGLAAFDASASAAKRQGAAAPGFYDTYELSNTFTNSTGGAATINEAMVRNNVASGSGQGYCHALFGSSPVVLANGDQLLATYQSQLIP